MKSVCVIGSLNIDLVAGVSQFVKPGETLKGKNFNKYYGGKGANQAVGLAKLGIDVAMVGCVGKDVDGQAYRAYLEGLGVNCDMLMAVDDHTGIAMIEVESTGENRIIIVPGANDCVTDDYLDMHLKAMLAYDIFLLQLETPLEGIEYIVKALKDHGKTVVLDPAPATYLSDNLLSCVDVLTPNETELGILTENKKGIVEAGQVLLEKGVASVVAKVGSKGAYLVTEKDHIHFDVIPVTPVDTTAAGDAFNAGLAYGMAYDLGLFRSVEIGMVTGGVSTEGHGAQTAMATEAVLKEKLLEKKS